MKSYPDALTIKEWPLRDWERSSLFPPNGSTCDRPTLWEKTKWRSLLGSAVRWCRSAGPPSVPPDGCIGAVFFAVRKCVVFLGIFFFTLSGSTLNLYYSVHFQVAEGSFRSFRAFFFSVDPSVGRTDATVVLHWAYKRSTEAFDPEITVLLIVAEKIPEDNLICNQKKATLKSKARKSP